ncbi:helix-turn-helix domain-containing protein [Paenibacillus tarimensis]
MSYVASVQRAIDYIEEHLDEHLDLSSIAEEAYISVAQLYRVFYALTGHPVKDYIRKRRISVASNHLRNSNRTVEEIAWDSGFQSYHSFAKVFKKIVGMTPAAYRNADIYFSFEPICLHEQVAYQEDKELTERFPDVKVIRFMPEKMYSYVYVSERETGIENEAFRIVHEKLCSIEATGSDKPKVRVFGNNVDLPEKKPKPRYGYRMLILGDGQWLADNMFQEEAFTGGLYAVGKVNVSSPETVQQAWNRLLSEWLPKSTFEIGPHQYMEEFIAYNGKVSRMKLYLPVQRKFYNEPIEVVELPNAAAFYFRGYGSKAQAVAEKRLIDWYGQGNGESRVLGQWKYYMSYHYGSGEADEYWWENGILTDEREVSGIKAIERKCIGSGYYACCVSKTYGLLTGVLDILHRWIAANDHYRLDEERQWFAEYHTSGGTNVERDTIVKVYVPVK